MEECNDDENRRQQQHTDRGKTTRHPTKRLHGAVTFRHDAHHSPNNLPRPNAGSSTAYLKTKGGTTPAPHPVRRHTRGQGTTVHWRTGSDIRPDERDTVVICMQFSPLAPSTLTVVVSTLPLALPPAPEDSYV